MGKKRSMIIEASAEKRKRQQEKKTADQPYRKLRFEFQIMGAFFKLIEEHEIGRIAALCIYAIQVMRNVETTGRRTFVPFLHGVLITVRKLMVQYLKIEFNM